MPGHPHHVMERGSGARVGTLPGVGVEAGKIQVR
jgi:hypothetical protein